MTIDQLQHCFSTPGVRFEAGKGNLTCIRVATDAAEAELYLLGAHVTKFKPAGGPELLFVSAHSNWSAGKPIRGGVPICFPWFGPNAANADAPMHGFARLREFEVESITAQPAGVEIVLRLSSDAETRKWWDADFVLRHCILIGKTLTMTLEVENRGQKAIRFEEALHTYFAVDDVRQVAVRGLENTRYLDKTDGGKQKTQDGNPIKITAETDRLYLGTTAATTIEHATHGRSIRVEKDGSNATVVWNPWVAKSKALADFGDEEWPGMICVETVNANEAAVELPAGQTHRMTARVVLQ
jgi:glucose-6-phosphate 1-epimerase